MPVRSGGQDAFYKVALFLKRASGVSASGFSDAWRTATPSVPGQAVPGQGLHRHVHNVAVQDDLPIENAPPAPFDAVDEYEFDNAGQAQAFFAGAAFQDQWLAPRRALLDSAPLALSGPARCLFERESGAHYPRAVKILTLPVRRAGMDMEEFFAYWTIQHSGLALSGPGTTDRLVRLVATAAAPAPLAGFARAPFDGIGNIVFDSPESLAAEFASDHYRENLAPDEPRFTDPVRSRGMMVREVVLFAA